MIVIASFEAFFDHGSVMYHSLLLLPVPQPLTLAPGPCMRQNVSGSIPKYIRKNPTETVACEEENCCNIVALNDSSHVSIRTVVTPPSLAR